MCSKSCGGGDQFRNRRCSSGNDDDCIGNGSETQKCGLNQCPVWNEWQDWEGCSVTCGRGHRNRFRGCTTGRLVDCFGDSIEQEDCSAGMCPTKAPKTIVTLPVEENRFSDVDESYSPPTPPTGFVNVQVEEFAGTDDLYQSALNGFDQFGGSANQKSENGLIGRQGARPNANYDSKDFYDYSYDYSNTYYSDNYDLTALRPTNSAKSSQKIHFHFKAWENENL